MPTDINDMLRHLRAHIAPDYEDGPPPISFDGEVECLRYAFRALNTRHAFVPGMIIRQKPGCRVYKDTPNGVAIVVEMLDEIILETETSSQTSGFRIPMDMIIALRSADGDINLFHVDSRRFEPYPGLAP